MAERVQKIILFLSDFKQDALPRDYLCPDGEIVQGAQTWQAPVRYLLHAHPQTSELLCVVTARAEESFAALCRMLAAEAPGVQAKRIPFDRDEEFSAGPLSALMDEITATQDEILLETTGGLRDAVMQLLLVSRILSYKGVPTVGAVYSNFGEGRVVDCSHLIQLFGLVGGLQEFTSFGSVRTLRAYYEELAQTTGEAMDERVRELLDAMQQLTGTIALCRTRQLKEGTDRLNAALKRAKSCDDVFIRQLCETFRQEYGTLDTPGVVHWCVENEMLHQALTIYTERMPACLNGRLLQMPMKSEWKSKENPDADALLNGLLLLAKGDHSGGIPQPPRQIAADSTENGRQLRNGWYRVQTVKNLTRCLRANPQYKVLCETRELQVVLQDYLYIKELRNMASHANNRCNDVQKQLMDHLGPKGYPPLEDTTAQTVSKALEDALAHIRQAQQR